MTSAGELQAMRSDQLRIASLADREEIMIKEDRVRVVGGCSQISPAPDLICSVVACFRMPDLTFVQGSWARAETDLEYVPSYLAYREGPVLAKAFDMLGTRLDVLLVRAAGVDHPEGLGMARHMGYLLSVPTIGVTESPLSTDKTRNRPGPLPFCPGPGRATVHISRGWEVDWPTSVGIVRSCTRNHRMPEPIHTAKALCRALIGPFVREVFRDGGYLQPERMP